MLSAEEHSGIVTFLLGVIIVVMVAVGLSVLVDKRARGSSEAGGIRREITAGSEEIAELRSLLDEKTRRLGSLEAGGKAADEARRTLAARTTAASSRLSGLAESRQVLQRELATLGEAISEYRTRYRKVTWEKAVGRNLGTLKLRNGQEYQYAVIIRVTPVGLEIRHDHGNARIQAPDLDPEMQDRFQWSDEERRKRLDAESETEKAAQAAGAPARETRPSSRTRRMNVKPVDPEAAQKREEIEKSRREVVAWRSKVGRLRRELDEASGNAYGSQESVPGSLETWRAKSDRLGRELAAARGGLGAAKARLSSLAPGDSLLKDLTEAD